MTNRKMKKYIKSIERRLNLPRDIKERVMSDLVSSIRARQEAGHTDEEIISELGTPAKAAADLNEQMKEFAYRKSPWRFAFAALAAYGAAELLGSAWAQILYWILRADTIFTPGESASVGVIGGADGPTAIFVTSPGWMHILIPVLMLAVGIWGFLRLRKCKGN